jgi:hypothetical protein
MAEENTRRRTQYLLASLLAETRNAFDRLHETKPRAFRSDLVHTVFEVQRWQEVRARLNDAIRLIRVGKEIDWDVIEEVGLSGDMLEWKADLFYLTVGQPKPKGEENVQAFEDRPILTYPEGKPVWRRFLKLAKSLFDSLIKGLSENSKLRYVLDFIKEYMECVEAAVLLNQRTPEPEP